MSFPEFERTNRMQCEYLRS